MQVIHLALAFDQNFLAPYYALTTSILGYWFLTNLDATYSGTKARSI